MTGISRKLPEPERDRLKKILKKVVPDDAGVIIRTAAEGASEEEIAGDVRRLQAQWEVIKTKADKGGAPVLLHAEPDLVIRVVRDVFNEDFTQLVVQGDSEWETIRDYVEFVAPDLAPRLSRHTVRAGRLRRAPRRRAAAQGARPQGLPAVRRLAGHRPHRGDGRHRRQHRQVRRQGRQPRGDGHPQQPRGRRGDRPAAAPARRRRDHRRRLHRHGPREQPRPRRAPPRRVPGPRPHQAPGRRGDLARAGADDAQARRPGPARVVQRAVRVLQRPGRARAPRAGRRAPGRRQATATTASRPRARVRAAKPLPRGRAASRCGHRRHGSRAGARPARPAAARARPRRPRARRRRGGRGTGAATVAPESELSELLADASPAEADAVAAAVEVVDAAVEQGTIGQTWGSGTEAQLDDQPTPAMEDLPVDATPNEVVGAVVDADLEIGTGTAGARSSRPPRTSPSTSTSRCPSRCRTARRPRTSCSARRRRRSPPWPSRPSSEPAAPAPRRRRRATSRPAGPPTA